MATENGAVRHCFGHVEIEFEAIAEMSDRTILYYVLVL